MIDVKKLKELVKLMVDNDLTELDLQDQGERVTLKRGGGESPVQYVAPAPPQIAPVPPAPSRAEPVATPEDGLVAITSPMVGTFYAAPNPETPPFVQVGARVQADTVVCVIEAMKVFNEIRAEIAGTVAKVLVENGQAVEFGQPLFLVKK
jgi:acetyl-CoA carboxylase biotin carboxyl carrier protein